MNPFNIKEEDRNRLATLPQIDLGLGLPMTTAQSTPAMTTEKSPFITAVLPRKEAVPFRGAFRAEPVQTKAPPIVTAIGSVGTDLLEVIPKVAVQLFANKRGIDARVVGKPEEPLDLSFANMGKRLGFDSNQIKSSGNVFMEEFDRREAENPSKSNTQFLKNFALAYLKPVSDILDTFVAGSELKSLAKIGLKATLTDPITDTALKELRITPQQASDWETLKYAFNRQAETILARGGNIKDLNRLGGMTEHLINQITGGEGIKGLNKLGELVKKTSQTFLEDITKIQNIKGLPMGLSIKDVSRQLPAKIDEAGKLVEQIKKAGGDIQKAQGILTDITKASSLDIADSLLGELKNLSGFKVGDLAQEARKYKTAEEFVKAQGEGKNILYRAKDSSSGYAELGNGIYGADKPELARLFGKDIERIEVSPNAKIIIEGSPEYENLARAVTPRGDYKMNPELARKIALARGIDGIKGIDPDTGTVIFNEKVITSRSPIKSKSQLTDIFNKAQKEIKPTETPSLVDSLISEGKIKIESIKGKDIYSYQTPKGFKQAPSEDVAIERALKEPISKDISPELQERIIDLELKREIVENSPVKELSKYVARSGEFKGGLPEVTGKGKSIFGRQGDDIVTELGFKDSEEAREAYIQYASQKKELEELEQQLKEDIKSAKAPKKPTEATQKTLEDEVVKTAIQMRDTASARSLDKVAQQALAEANRGGNSGAFSLPKTIEHFQTPVNKKIRWFDYIKTPEKVLNRIGLGDEMNYLRKQYEKYLEELPKNIAKITEWSKQVPKESNVRIFKWLDGQAIDLRPDEKKVAKEIKTWLSEWADRLGLPDDDRIAHYITHIFDDQLIQKEFDEDLAKIIADKVAGSVYDPFLLKRLGAKGYRQDTWAALDAYAKRATRKVHMDSALEKIKDKVEPMEKTQWNFIKRYTDGLNMRPTETDDLLDNEIKNIIGYRFGQRPVALVSSFLRRMTYRSMLGLNLSSALKNLSQGINTYAVLGEKYTALGYLKLLSSGAREELVKEGVLKNDFIQDRVLSATKKTIEKIDKVLYFFFENAERINRGSAYFGAKAKALNAGKTPEQAIEYAKKIVRQTQFSFSSIDTPVALQSDIAKTLGQFQTFTTKQIEFLTELAKNKQFGAIIRYAISGMAFVYTIGKAFGMEPKELIPIWRIGTPPSLKFPVEVVKAILGFPDKYGRERDIGKKISDVGKSFLGLIPAGTQAKKTIEGVGAVKKGFSSTKAGSFQFPVGGTLLKNIQAVLFGKFASQKAKEYFNKKSPKPSKVNPFNI